MCDGLSWDRLGWVGSVCQLLLLAALSDELVCLSSVWAGFCVATELAD